MSKRFHALVLLLLTASCSGDTGTPVLFQGDPGIHNLPANVEFEPIVGGAPPVKFVFLKYENHFLDKSSGKTGLPYTSAVTLQAHESHFAVTKTDFFISQPNGSFTKQVTDVNVGVPGIISLVHLTTKHQTPRRIQFRKVVRRIENIEGRLFPLDKGGRLSFDVVFAYQVTRGQENDAAKELRWSYGFHIIGHYEGYSLPGRTISGNIYVIDRQELDPEGGIDLTRIHFAESLGAVIKTVRQGEEFIEETRLVSMGAPSSVQ